MPFDSTQFDYTKVQPVYDKDNPPKRMSEAIRMAVADLRKVEASPDHTVRMIYFHAPKIGDLEQCAVCFAGAVMAKRLGADPDDELYEDSFGGAWKKVFTFLDALRSGYMTGARDSWATGTMTQVDDRPNELGITFYESDPLQFKADMLALADRLEAEGS